MTKPAIERVLLVQPNYGILGRRSWPTSPYGLGLLKASLAGEFLCEIADFNYALDDEAAIRAALRRLRPHVVGLSSYSSEYSEEVHHHAAIVRQELPEAVIVGGGPYPSVLAEEAAKDPHVDYWVLGEGEYRFPQLLRALRDGTDPMEIDGIACCRKGVPTISPMKTFIPDLDAIPFPAYDAGEIQRYGAEAIKYIHIYTARQYPFATTVTSRGCPFKCVFCAGRTVSGAKVRMRSAENVLREIAWLHDEHGVKEIIFLDDHFFSNKDRAMQIMRGIRDRFPDMTWKCSNIAIFSLDEELLDLKYESGCYQFSVSIESGDQYVLDHIMHKPVNLGHARKIISHARSLGFEILSNFVIGLPGETWQQVRNTFAFAEEIDIDCVLFHIATPMPKTRLIDICIERGLIDPNDIGRGFTKGVIHTDEFSPTDLEILRTYEWDRINFTSPARTQKIAEMFGLTLEEVDSWRKDARKNLGRTLGWTHKPEGS